MFVHIYNKERPLFFDLKLHASLIRRKNSTEFRKSVPKQPIFY